MLSKAAVLFVFTVTALLLFILAQILSNWLLFGYVEWGNGSDFIKYLAIQIFLHFSLCLVIMAVSVISRSNIFSIIFGLFVCMNVFSILYGIIDKLAANMGYHSFRTVTYTVSGKIALMPMTPGIKDILPAATTALIFILIALGASSIIFQKRDID